MPSAPTRRESGSTAQGGHHVLVAAVLACGSLAMFWPGVAEYDTVRQYEQILSGRYDDWHPPVMARLWSLLLSIAPGTGPLLLLQIGGYWLGFGLIAAALARVGRGRAGWAVLVVGSCPLVLGWQGVVVKDAQLVGAVLAAVGLIAWWQLRGRAIPTIAIVAVVVLLGYAMLVRANAVFALAPLIAVLLPLSVARRVAVAATLVLAIIALSGPINHRLLGAQSSGVEKTQALYDVAGITARLPEAGAGLRAAGCVTPFFWDPLGDTPACRAIVAPLKRLPAGRLWRRLATGVMAHPGAYVAQRVAHWNMTERWLVPAGLPGAEPPSGGEPNTYGLDNPPNASARWDALTAFVATSPVGWPIVWTTLAMLAMWEARTRLPSAARTLATALLASAIAIEASFVVISIASDLRYHLWSMVATALAIVLLADRIPPTRRSATAGVMVAIVMAAGIAARITLPAPPPGDDTMRVWTPPLALLPD